MKTLLTFIFTLAFSAQAGIGGSETGNGGDGIYRNGILQLLDFVEEGLEKPFIERDITDVPAIREIVRQAALPTWVPADDLTKKLSEIYTYRSQTLALALAMTLKHYTFRLTPYPLKNVKDENSPVAGRYYQLADRLGRSIYVYRRLWRELPPAHRVGLIFHEIVYALTKPLPIGSHDFIQRSETVRQSVAFFFRPKWHQEPREFDRYTHLLPTDGTKAKVHGNRLVIDRDQAALQVSVFRFEKSCAGCEKKSQIHQDLFEVRHHDLASVQAICRHLGKVSGTSFYLLPVARIPAGYTLEFSSYPQNGQHKDYVAWTAGTFADWGTADFHSSPLIFDWQSTRHCESLVKEWVPAQGL